MSNPDYVQIIYNQPISAITFLLISLILYFIRIRFESNERTRIDSKLAHLKAEHDKVLTELKSKIDIHTQRAQLIDKTQFMHEYDLYKEAWELIQILNKKINKFESISPTDSQRGRMEPLISDANESHEKYTEHLEKNKPFYPEKVFKALHAICEINYETITNYITNADNRKEYLTKKSKNRDQLKQHTENAIIAIRERMTEVRVI